LLCTSEEADKFDWPERNNVEWYYSHKLPARTIGFHIGHFKPNMQGGTHRHSCEALIYILEGDGYSAVDGETIEWKAGDALFVPPMAWHAHHSGPSGARIIGMWNVPLLEAMGLYYNEEAGDTGHPDAKHQVRTTLLPEREPTPVDVS
jgi:gentisate 1,2-dioxygenase